MTERKKALVTGGATGIGVVGIYLEWRLRVRGAGSVAAFADTFWLVAALAALATAAALRMRMPRSRGGTP